MRISTSGSRLRNLVYSTGVPWKRLATSTARSWVRLVTKMCDAPERRRCRAEKMMDRCAAFMMIETRTERSYRGLARLGQEFADQDAQVDGVVAGHHHLHTIARGEDERFRNAFLRFQLRQGRRQNSFRKSQALADFHGGRLVADACDQQFHCVMLNLRPVCAA